MHILLIDMRARETSSRQNHRPVPAYLDLSALEKRRQTTPDRTRLSRSCACNQALSNPLPVSSFAIKPCSGSRPSATDPLHPNSNEIKVCSGVAERTPFFVKKSKAAAPVSGFFTRSKERRTRRNCHSDENCQKMSKLRVPG